jgi:hypothetical protein
MPAHPKTFERIERRLQMTTDPVLRDALLDEMLDVRELATNWDADQWGLNPDDPMWDMPTTDCA